MRYVDLLIFWGVTRPPLRQLLGPLVVHEEPIHGEGEQLQFISLKSSTLDRSTGHDLAQLRFTEGGPLQSQINQPAKHCSKRKPFACTVLTDRPAFLLRLT